MLLGFSCKFALGQLWSLCRKMVQARLRAQLNSILYAKTLVRKDIASSVPAQEDPLTLAANDSNDENNDNLSSKAQIMTLMCVRI